jgi:hypothetical protein
MSTIAIMQPTYLPWLGYFAMMDRVDHFVFLDHVQFARRSWQQRNRIKSARGELMLTVPVAKRGQRDAAINEVLIDYGHDFPASHVSSISHAYARAPHFGTLWPDLRAILEARHETLLALDLAIIRLFMKRLGIATPTSLSSALGLTEKREALLVAICRAHGATRYLSAPGSMDYLGDDGLFRANGIALDLHRYEHPAYPQLHGAFLPYMSALDALAMLGPGARAAMLEGVR